MNRKSHHEENACLAVCFSLARLRGLYYERATDRAMRAIQISWRGRQAHIDPSLRSHGIHGSLVAVNQQ